jgi:hypothetical protein
MGLTATFAVKARFNDAPSAERVVRYLPEGGREALIDDVPPADQEAYQVIEELEYGLVERLDTGTLLCRFDFSEVDDFDEEAAHVLDAFRALGAHDLRSVVMADEENAIYVGLEEGKTGLLILNKARQRALKEARANEIVDAADKLLAEGSVVRWPGERWDAPDAPKQPTLVILPAADEELDDDEGEV